MEIELPPAISLPEETFNVLIAPVEMLVEALNSHLELQRYKILFISGNYSRILSRLDRNFTELEIRRAFTSFQLMTILEENLHSFLIVEHDPMLYEDAGSTGHAGGILMRWPWKREARPLSPGGQSTPRQWSWRRPRRYWRRSSMPGPRMWRR
ncbi:Uncharacterised protein [uncultured archaeon]|nr:Uncharacterised protein [uncultured archaeon]